MLRVMLVAAVAALVGACNTTSEQVAAPAEPPPANYRQVVAAHIKTAYFDPYSVRDAAIAPPRPGQAHAGGFTHENGWAVCVRANAKNRMGAYTGIKPAVYIVRGDAVVASQSEDLHYDVRRNCEGAVYEPFPEIEQGGQPARPATAKR